jgi:UDP-3-O-[3-hydroxymyristoyl] N-acetylglucosamine deacetylase
MEVFGLKGEVSFKGVGIHTGAPSRVLVAPFEKTGLFFALPGGIFPVQTAAADGTARGTTLTFPDGSRVMTAEHLLAALAGLGVWSALLTLSGLEIPALDGSARPFVEALAPLREPGWEVVPVAAAREIAFGDSRGAFMGVIPSDRFEITCSIRYDAPAVGAQVYEGVVTSDTFAEDVAPARTFVLDSEIAGIRDRGLGRGGAVDNVLVIDDGDPHATSTYRVPGEPVRHKVLDLIGDLATLGRPLKGRVIAHKAGHRMHLELVRRIRRGLLLF